MRRTFTLVALAVGLGIAQPASAGIFAFNLDGQIGYSQLQHIRVPQSNGYTVSIQSLSVDSIPEAAYIPTRRVL